ncbi:MAG: hypothetical protein CL607_06620 [Anaerolineaceae bacterium]|nr:hypothetical protein [Anaerolineaceae bacterium]
MVMTRFRTNFLMMMIVLCLGAWTVAPEPSQQVNDTFPTPSPLNMDAPRGFHMGFTPFPYEISMDAVQWVYEALANDSDIIMHHFDNGVPWPEALASDAYSEHIMNDWELRRSLTPPDHALILSMTPIAFQRDGLALYRGEADDMPLPAPWDGYSFDHPDVVTAYFNHVQRSIDYFEPDYLVMGIEVNLLLNVRPDLWDGYVQMQQLVYNKLKTLYPDMPMMVSVVGVGFFPEYAPEYDLDTQLAGLAQVIPYSDYFALSLYPYMSGLMTNDIPVDYFDRLFALAGDKPIAISETGYPAQTLELQDAGLTFPSTPEKQHAYITGLLAQADAYDLQFIVNFVLRDYDALYDAIGGGDLAAIWRDTGFYDENGLGRPALEAWQQTLARPYMP